MLLKVDYVSDLQLGLGVELLVLLHQLRDHCDVSELEEHLKGPLGLVHQLGWSLGQPERSLQGSIVDSSRSGR